MGKRRRPEFTPNEIAGPVRWWNTAMAVYLLAWGGHGLYRNNLAFSVRGNTIAQFRDGPAWLMAGALFCGALVLLSVVIDHYDRRPNESAYRAFRWGVVRLGWCFFAASLASHLFLFFSGGRS